MPRFVVALQAVVRPNDYSSPTEDDHFRTEIDINVDAPSREAAARKIAHAITRLLENDRPSNPPTDKSP